MESETKTKIKTNSKKQRTDLYFPDVEVGETGDDGQQVQTSGHNVNTFWRYNVQQSN